MEISVEALRAQERISQKQSLTELAEEIHQNNKNAGWYDPTKVRRPAEIHMLIVTEIAEATEEIRKGTPPVYVVHDNKNIEIVSHLLSSLIDSNIPITQKPEGELIELADAVIRILDYCASKNWDIDSAVRYKARYNLTRSQRHGGKLL